MIDINDVKLTMQEYRFPQSSPKGIESSSIAESEELKHEESSDTVSLESQQLEAEILIVDDNSFNIFSLKNVLKTLLNMESDAAYNG